jgi:hypothetical protein
MILFDDSVGLRWQTIKILLLRGSFWINPTLFFKGDRVAFITEYRRKKETEQDRLEQEGQQRLIK